MSAIASLDHLSRAEMTDLWRFWSGADGPPPAFELRQAGQRLRFVRQ